MSNKIKIYGDIESASIFFVGSTVTPKPMGVVVANAHPTLTDRVVIKRNDRFKRDKISFRVLFRQLNINRIENKDGQELVGTLGYDLAQVVEYINSQSNLSAGTSGGDGSGTDMAGLDVCFKLDATSTSIMMDTGHEFGVNTIKAVENNGLIDIVSELGTLVHFTNLEVGRVCGNDGSMISGGLNDVINYLNELFTVGAFEQVVISDPYSTMIADVNGIDSGYTLEGADAIDPIGDDIFTYDGVGYANYAGLKSTAIIDQKGEYYTFDIRGEGTIGFGLIHTDDSFNNGLYSGNANYADPSSFAAVNSAHYGFQFSHWFHATPNGSWTNYGANTGYSGGAGWSNFNGTNEQADWLAGNPIKIKVGIDENGYIAISTLRNGTDWVMHSRSSYPLPQGSSYHLGIKSQSTSARVYTAPKVHLLEPEAPTMYFRYVESPDGVFQYPLFATTVEAEYYDEQNGGSGQYHSHVFVDDPTNTTWYMPEANAEHNGTSAPAADLTLGQSAIYTEITTLSDSDFAPSSFIIAQQYMIEGGTLNLQVSPQDVSYVTTIANGPSWLSLSNGYLLTGTANYVSENTDFNVDIIRTNSYGSATCNLTVTVQDDIVASQLSGITTAYGNTLNPNNVFNTEGFAGRLDTIISQGQEVSWTHRDFTVGGFLTSGAESNFNSGVDVEASSNWDVRFSTWTSELMKTFSRGWAVGGSQNIGNLDGATHKLVYKSDGFVEFYTNDVLYYTSASSYSGDKYLYFMTPDTYNLNIELPADITVTTIGAGATVPPSGFTSPLLQGEMGATDIMGNGADSAAESAFTIASGKRLIVTGLWVEQNILPYFDSNDDKVFFGIPKSSAAYNSVTLDDFEAVIRLQQASNSSHKSLLYRGPVLNNEVTINSNTDSVYDYAFEFDGTDLHIIADTYANLTSIHSVSDGGSFARVVSATNVGLSGPLSFVIATNDDGQVKLNPQFVVADIPATPATQLTNWTKALDFSGSNEHLKMVTTSTAVNAIRMSGLSAAAGNNTDSNKTSNSSNALPFATAIVFRIDGNNSNQHIWNSGEGSGNSDDNIYLRLTSDRSLFFGWGRGSDNNECRIATNLNTSHWYGIYVASKGARFNSSGATNVNLALAFDIRMATSEYSFPSVTSNLSTEDNWGVYGSTGHSMQRATTGDFTIGGRGSNRNFHGKVASMVVTTLMKNADAPTDAEILTMITDPVKWVTDYKIGQTYRYAANDSTSTFTIGQTASFYATQVWLMGDGASDSYANGIRNYIYTGDQNATKLQLNSMVSNDIETVNINGLT